MKRHPTGSTASTMVVLLLFLLSILPDRCAAQPAIKKEDQAKLVELQLKLKQAGALYLRRDLKESAALVKDVQAALEKLTANADPQLLKAAAPIYASLQRAHQLLSQRGIKNLPPLKPLGRQPAKPIPPPSPDGPVMFSAHVAPILIAKCGRCHVNNARGMVSMANYETLMKGPDAGAIVLPGNAVGSRIIEVIEEGDMPRGGLQVTPPELTILKKWIAEGAKYDGDDPKASLTAIAPGAKPADVVRVEPRRATGKESVQFSTDIAPVFVEKCLGCHGDGDRPGGRFNMSTVATMLRGGDSGPAILPGKPDDSLLVKKLLGMGGGERMPRNQPPLNDGTITTIKTWIAEGATIDEGGFDLNLRQLVAVARTKRQTVEEVSQRRAELALANWKLSLPEVTFQSYTSDHFYVLGTLDEERLAAIAREAETAFNRIKALVRRSKSDDVIKGRVTLFVLSRRYDYSEFGTMVEKREVPPEERATARYTVVDAYVALYVPPTDDQEKLGATLIEPLAELAVSAAGDAPRWYRVGLARAITAKLAKTDPKVKAWTERAGLVAAATTEASDILNGTLPDDDSNIAAMIVGSYLLKDSRRFKRLQGLLAEGQPFDAAFAVCFGASPKAWLEKLMGKDNKRR